MAHTSAKKGINKISGIPLVDFDVLMKEATEFLSKALTRDDAPPKEKHVRSAVVSTYQENGCTVFFTILESRLNNWPFSVPIVGYKACYMYHRLLRDGHHRVVKQSEGRYQDVIKHMKSVFRYDDELGYCRLTQAYCGFILTKLTMHLKHDFLPTVIREDGIRLTIFDEPDVNFLFGFISEMLDFLELQVNFIASVLRRLDPSAKLPTSHTHCVIHPLLGFIPESFDTYMVIQDIFICLKTQLDDETLRGHRKRILEFRTALSRAYGSCSQLSYLLGILRSVPKLPALPKEISAPPAVPQQPEPQRVNVPRTDSADSFTRKFSAKFDFQSDNLERQLMTATRRIADLVLQVDGLKAERMEDHQRLFDAGNDSEMLKSEVGELKRENSELKEQVAQHAASMETSEQVAAANAKYLRLKELYTELRNGHVDLIREKAKSDKVASNMNDRVVDLQAEKEALTAAVEAAKDEHALLEESVKSAEEHVSETSLRADRQEKASKEKIANLSQQLAEREEELQKLNVDFTTKQGEAERLSTELSASKDLTGSTQTKVTELEHSMKEKVEKLEGLLAERDGELKKVTAEFQSKQSEAERLTNELTSSKELTGNTQTRVTELEASMKEKVASLEGSLSQRVQEIEKLTLEFKTEQSEAKRLGTELASANESAVLFKQSAGDKDKDVAQKIESLQHELTERRQELSKMTVEFDSQQTESKRLAAELATAQETAVSFKQDASMKDKQAVERIEMLQKEVTNRQDEVQTMTVQFSSEQDQSSKLRTELATTKEQKANKDRELAEALENLTRLRAEMEASLAAQRKRQEDLSHAVLVQALDSAQQEIKEAGGSGTRAVSASALVDCTQAALGRCDELTAALETYRKDHNTVPAAATSVNHLSHSLCRVLEDANAVAASNSSTAMVDRVHRLSEVSGRSLEALKDKNADSAAISKAISSILSVIKEINGEAKDLVPAELKQIEAVGRSVETEMNYMADAVQQAADRIEAMMERSKETDTGEQLEVNSRILDSSSELMKAIRILIAESRSLQKEIVESGRGTLSVDQFYQKNSRWTEGLLSAAQMVGHGAQHLVECADQVVTGQGKFEELEVASHDIAASTAQLVAASQAKADQHSKQLATLKAASKVVTEKTGHVVVSAKSGVKAKKRAEQPDYSKLSAIQGKRAEMEIQVRLLELESEVDHTRNQLGEIRRLGYSRDTNSKPSSGKTSPYP